MLRRWPGAIALLMLGVAVLVGVITQSAIHDNREYNKLPKVMTNASIVSSNWGRSIGLPRLR